MFCTACNKLSHLNTIKKCPRCKSEILINISVICDFCSLNTKSCSCCLKKIINKIDRKPICKACGSK